MLLLDHSPSDTVQAACVGRLSECLDSTSFGFGGSEKIQEDPKRSSLLTANKGVCFEKSKCSTFSFVGVFI